VVGELCTPKDVLAHDVLLPRARTPEHVFLGGSAATIAADG